MTLDEKIAMVHGVSGPYVGDTTNNARLGIPALHLEDGPAGIADGASGVTAYPAPIALAASWDVALARQYGAMLGTEARGKGVHILLGPMMNMVRVPQGGRAYETFGEDPFLSGKISAADIQGIQSQGVLAAAKHFVCNDQETDRGSENSVVDERTLNEIYLRPFLDSVRGGLGCLFTSYNLLNGWWASETPLLRTEVKRDWGFKGFVLCDWGANFDTDTAATNGLDMEMPSGLRFGTPLQNDIQSGAVPASQLDNMVQRILAAMFRFGIFDNPTTGSLSAVVTGSAGIQFSRTVAENSIVLLKNTSGLLPLNAAGIHSIAVLGSVADQAAIFTGTGSAQVYPAYYTTPLDAITSRAGSGITVNYSQGDGGFTNQAAQLAAQADVAIVCIGEQTGEGLDRTNLDFPGDQDDLVKAVTAVNPNTIVVVYEDAGTIMPWLNGASAVLCAWYPGQEGATALASILFGDVNPSGKLPLTFPAATNQVPANTPAQFPGINFDVDYSEGLEMGYRWYDANNITPLFEFGFGLSYTTFGYSNLSVGPVSPAGQVQIATDVSNTGPLAGSEIAQLYLGFPPGAGEPPLVLKGFQKFSLKPGQTQHVVFNLDWEDLACWDTNSESWTVPPGNFQVMVGASSRDIRLSGSFTVASPIPSSGVANLALYSPATASSAPNTNNPAAAAVDGDPSTSWVSAPGNIQAFTVDLGTATNFNRVRLRWGANYGSSYRILQSNDGNTWTSIYTNNNGLGGSEDLLVNGMGRYVQMAATQSGTGSGYTLNEFEVFSGTIQSLFNIVWVDDTLPAGAQPGADGGDGWNWVSNNPAPFAGAVANQSTITSGLHQHFFVGATATLSILTNDVLFAYVYVDPSNLPSEIMLQWYDGNSWEHRAYWGGNFITYGVYGTASRQYLGPVPAAGQWVKLLVPASLVGLEGSTLTGMAFTLYDGRATWDYAGKTTSSLAGRMPAFDGGPIGSFSNQGWQLQLFSNLGWRYTMLRSTDLKSWTPLAPSVGGNGANLSLVDASPPGGKAFYRVLAGPE